MVSGIDCSPAEVLDRPSLPKSLESTLRVTADQIEGVSEWFGSNLSALFFVRICVRFSFRTRISAFARFLPVPRQGPPN